MAPELRLPMLAELWREDAPDSLRCCKCQKPFVEAPLIRTFQVFKKSEETATENPNPADSKDGGDQGVTVGRRQIEALGSILEIYDRHLECLDGVPFVAISHVWDPEISDMQNSGEETKDSQRARMRVFDSVFGIVEGLLRCKGDSRLDEFEVWHDYLSVPQWEDALKVRILTAIRSVFRNASFTVVHLDDVTRAMVEKLRHGETSQERIDGMTGICNARWFSRVWTFMEYVRSGRTKVMVAECDVVDGVDDVFIGELDGVFDKELELHGGNVHEVEGKAGLGKNKVPWCLGPLQVSRQLKTVDYGVAWGGLSMRHCRSERDFFHAICGIINADSAALDETMSNEVKTAKIISSCLRAGDYTPLFVTPKMPMHECFESNFREKLQGFNNTWEFALGPCVTRPALHHQTKIHDLRAILTLQRMGTVDAINHSARTNPPIHEFRTTVNCALPFVGGSATSFANTVCGRLYNQTQTTIDATLASPSRRAAVEGFLAARRNARTGRSWGNVVTLREARALADALDLYRFDGQTRNVPPLMFMNEHGGTLHAFPFTYLIAAACPGCGEESVYRATLYRPVAEVRGARAYRVPGLHHEWSRPNGLALLVSGDEGQGGGSRFVVGRMVWATPACECCLLEEVEFALDDLFPAPKNFGAEDKELWM